MSEYQTLVIDPPWAQGKTGLRSVRPNQGRSLPYETMSMEQLRALPLLDWAAEDAWLFLWATASRDRESGVPILYQAFDLLESWGFRYYTPLVWRKPTGPCPFGPIQITAEFVLFGYRGKLRPGKMGAMQSVFDAPVTRHSEKPDSFYTRLLEFTPAPRLDVFARRRHEGFDAWGDQVEGAGK